MPQFHAQYRTLNRIHAEVEPFDGVNIFLLLPPVAQDAGTARQIGIIRDQGSALSAGSKIFARVEAEAADPAQ